MALDLSRLVAASKHVSKPKLLLQTIAYSCKFTHVQSSLTDFACEK